MGWGLRSVYNEVRSRLIVQTNYDYRRSVFVSAGARTGSTWVCEIINAGGDYRFIFEPITLFRMLATKRFQAVLPAAPVVEGPLRSVTPVGERPPVNDRLLYIRPSIQDDELFALASNVLTGRFRHPATDQYNYTLRVVFEKRLVKETKSNLWIRWLYERFPGLKIVLVARHPIPTLLSRYHDWTERNPEQRRKDFRELVLGQPDLVADHLEPLRAVLEGAESMMEQRIAVWCTEYYVPLRQFAPGEIHVAFYEDFCDEPQAAAAALLEFLGEHPHSRALQRVVGRIQKPSSTAKRDATPWEKAPQRVDPRAQLYKWKDQISAPNLRAAAAMLSAFGLDRLYSVDDPLPKKDGLPRVMRAV